MSTYKTEPNHVQRFLSVLDPLKYVKILHHGTSKGPIVPRLILTESQKDLVKQHSQRSPTAMCRKFTSEKRGVEKSQKDLVKPNLQQSATAVYRQFSNEKRVVEESPKGLVKPNLQRSSTEMCRNFSSDKRCMEARQSKKNLLSFTSDKI